MDFTVTKIADNLYEFTESADFAGNGHPVPYVDSYLYIGDSRAAVIDTLQNAKGLYAAVREITPPPRRRPHHPRPRRPCGRFDGGIRRSGMQGLYGHGGL